MKLFVKYFKKNWAWGLLFAVPLVFWQKGYVYPELRFEYDFLRENATYYEMLFYWAFWTATQFFVWRPAYLFRERNSMKND